MALTIRISDRGDPVIFPDLIAQLFFQFVKLLCRDIKSDNQ